MSWDLRSTNGIARNTDRCGARQRVVDNRFMKASEKLFKLRVEGPMGCDAQALGSKDLQAETDIQSRGCTINKRRIVILCCLLARQARW